MLLSLLRDGRRQSNPFRAARLLLAPLPGTEPCRTMVHLGSVRIEANGWVTFAPDSPWEPCGEVVYDVFELSFPPERVRRIEWLRPADDEPDPYEFDLPGLDAAEGQ